MNRTVATPTVFLFDIDGTLITSGGAGRAAIIKSFERALGRPGIELPFSFAGMTDRLIVRLGLEALDLPTTEGMIDQVLEDYLKILAHEVSNAAAFRRHPGVSSLLETLRDLPESAIGLGTGNVEVGARIKLARVDLNHYFDFGGFGCDAEDRDALIACGARRGALVLGRPLSDSRVIIIGDTPRDISAAHALGAQCLAVATGGASYEALQEAGADWLFRRLDEPGVLPALLG
jgi:phosphoglycolate phosphatase